MKALYEVIRSNKLDILSPLLHVTRLKMVVVFCGLSFSRTEGESVSFLLDGFEKKQIIDKKPDERSRSHIFCLEL